MIAPVSEDPAPRIDDPSAVMPTGFPPGRHGSPRRAGPGRCRPREPGSCRPKHDERTQEPGRRGPSADQDDRPFPAGAARRSGPHGRLRRSGEGHRYEPATAEAGRRSEIPSAIDEGGSSRSTGRRSPPRFPAIPRQADRWEVTVTSRRTPSPIARRRTMRLAFTHPRTDQDHRTNATARQRAERPRRPIPGPSRSTNPDPVRASVARSRSGESVMRRKVVTNAIHRFLAIGDTGMSG